MSQNGHVFKSSPDTERGNKIKHKATNAGGKSKFMWYEPIKHIGCIGNKGHPDGVDV